jgi:hypothetical protein
MSQSLPIVINTTSNFQIGASRGRVSSRDWQLAELRSTLPNLIVTTVKRAKVKRAL